VRLDRRIYDDARRGWRYNLECNLQGNKAFKTARWNHFRIEDIGHSIRVWINSIPTADNLDDLTPKGFIALQVFSIGKDLAKAGSTLVKMR